ncbi:MAG: hypothetical protein EBT87_08445 [Alphaproteobacteria bacterium]|nr:hypothetical protein [Alphaproteobacteria bacterium]
MPKTWQNAASLLSSMSSKKATISAWHAWPVSSSKCSIACWMPMLLQMRHTSLFFEIMSGISDNPAQVSASSHMLFIAKNIERIGDYATGIAEQIYFLQYGVLPSDERPKADNSSMRALA